MTKKRVLTIDRSRWYRGKGSEESVLLNANGEMCCLGFDALACGLPADLIRGRETPGAVFYFDDWRSERSAEYGDYAATRFADFLHGRHSTCVTEAIQHNDDDLLSETERERLIRQDLMALGWDDVVFVDGPTA